MTHFMAFPTTVGKQQEVGVPMKQTTLAGVLTMTTWEVHPL